MHAWHRVKFSIHAAMNMFVREKSHENFHNVFSEITTREEIYYYYFSLSCKGSITVVLYRGNSTGEKSNRLPHHVSIC